jgi:hypothetical protein|tara:strand:+ start:4659 stop:5033 length:375 start_codon:yes stop_codon:yes gene_type:complete
MKKEKVSVPKKIRKSKYIDEITLVLSVAVLAIFVTYIDAKNENPLVDAEKITGLLLENGEFGIANVGVVDENKLQQLQKMDYVELKNDLDIKNDFCMYMVDGDGNVILSKGSSEINGDEVPCDG